MDELANQMKICLATVFSFYLKIHKFHWNVTGPDFIQYHEYLGDLYADVHGSVDMIAEHLRTLDEKSPGSLSEFQIMSKVSDSHGDPAAMQMWSVLASDNEIVLNEYKKACELADQAGNRGLVNFLEGRWDYHNDLHWRLNAFKG